ncbi:MAG TPA: hypothetical protein VGB14_16375 [Acidimicrobiales bacterium]|jgi:hypothetical protein
MFTIRQQRADGPVQVVDTRDGTTTEVPTRQQAVALVASALGDTVTAAAGVNESELLPDVWYSELAFSEDTGDGRDFTDCTWTARDPAVSTMPVFVQTQNLPAHWEARLAGFFTEVTGLGERAAPQGRGRWFAIDAGREARSIIAGAGRFGVSVDPGAVEVECAETEEDEDGVEWCTRWRFLAYEIIGMTVEPMPAFARAYVTLEGGETAGDDEARVAAGSAAPPLPARAWFDMTEPDDGDDRYVDQGQGRQAVPLTITDDGRVYGHAACWGACHVGFPGACVSPPRPESYASFHTGLTRCADGTEVNTGRLVVGCDHASTARGVSPSEARDHYAHAGLGWADVRVSNGRHGPWVAGVLLPDVTAAQVRVLRGLCLSGDWRGGELVGLLAVNVGGFPIRRETITASGLPMPASVRMAATTDAGETVALVAAGMVRRCAECEKRQRADLRATLELDGSSVMMLVDAMHGMEQNLSARLATLERRTRHLEPEALAYARSQVAPVRREPSAVAKRLRRG